MTSFGSQLRAAREESGWTIEYVSFKSKIQPNIIESLEEDDYALFSSSSYVKSFLRKYSEFLNLDLDDDISELEITGYGSGAGYSGCEGVKESLEMTQFSKKNQRYRKAEKSKGSPVFLVGSVVVLLSALAGFYYMGSQANSPEVGARDILEQFESKRDVFSRDREAKERLVSEKKPIAPLETSVTRNPPLASTRRSETPREQPQQALRIDPMSSFDSIAKPDVKTFNVPFDTTPEINRSSKPKIEPREMSPLFDY